MGVELQGRVENREVAGFTIFCKDRPSAVNIISVAGSVNRGCVNARHFDLLWDGPSGICR